jgi:two-component system OmpR family sensor kinase
MLQGLKNSRSGDINLPRLLAYVADLELEVDRLRRHNQLAWQEVRTALEDIQQVCGGGTAADRDSPALAEIDGRAKQLAGLLRDLRELPGYHPAHGQVIAIAVRALAEQVFRWQQRPLEVPEATCQLDLESEHVEWFPGRLRHILDNLMSNALKNREPDKVETWVRLGLKASPEGYKSRLTDHGTGQGSAECDRAFDLFYRAAPARAAGLGGGLAVVKVLVEQSGGHLTVDSGAGQGTTFMVVLPRYAVDDFLI